MIATVRMLRRRQVEELTGLCCSAIYDLMKAGRFPKPVKIGDRAVAWPQAEVDAWIAQRIAERDAKAQPDEQPQPAE